MIEQLDGVQGTVLYKDSFPMRLYCNDEDESYPPHWHSAVELLIPVNGNYSMRLNHQAISLQQGEALLIAPGVIHEISACPHGVLYIFQFNPQLFSQIHGFEQMTAFFSPYALLHPADRSQQSLLREYADRLYQVSVSDDPLRHSEMYLYGLRLLLMICASVQEPAPASPEPEPDMTPGADKYAHKFIEICSYIQKHCTEPMTLPDISTRSGFSQSHFLRLFKQFSGVTFYRYLNQCRITHAKNLLSTYPNLSINEVAAQSGFHSLATFNRLFRSLSGSTPSEFRSNLHL